MTLAENLIFWFDRNRRDLPWRKNVTAYHIWVSEVMLQQTQVTQVIPYYKKFIRQFPRMTDLAAADPDAVLKAWQGMGYYSRARNMHHAARIMIEKYNGLIPNDRKLLIKLPGFGPYITNAVLSLAYNQPYAVKDGNVMRVICRLFKITGDLRRSSTQAEIDDRVQDLLDTGQAGKFNEAMMELGATVCLPRTPQCNRCPLAEACQAHKHHLTSLIPFKSKTAQRPERVSHALILLWAHKVLLVQRPQNGLLGGLWEFPMCISEENTSAPTPQECLTNLKINACYVKSWKPIRHSYTHFQLQLIPVLYRLKEPHFYSDFYINHAWTELDKLEPFPMHRAMLKAIALITDELKEEFKNHNPGTDK